MHPSGSFIRFQLSRAVICLAFLSFFPACAPSPRPATPLPPEPQLVQLNERNEGLNRDLKLAADRIDELERQEAELARQRAEQEIRILQKEAMLNELERRMLAQQRRLDDAITEVVRAKAKLRSIESKAEAASTIAEAEIAVKSMSPRSDSTGDETLATARAKAVQLLEQSSREFKAQNYGGALYLAIQAKNQVGGGNRLPMADDAIAAAADETTFDHPLSLALAKNTNLRQGPALTSSVLTTLKAGTAIVGYSYKGDWIRVAAVPGTAGWVHQSLVTAR